MDCWQHDSSPRNEDNILQMPFVKQFWPSNGGRFFTITIHIIQVHMYHKTAHNQRTSLIKGERFRSGILWNENISDRAFAQIES